MKTESKFSHQLVLMCSCQYQFQQNPLSTFGDIKCRYTDTTCILRVYTRGTSWKERI